MFGRRRVCVAIGDIFVEALPGKKRVFKSLGIADAAPLGTFETQWKVVDIIDFDGLRHARIANRDSGLVRTIAVDALARQETYRKQ